VELSLLVFFTLVVVIPILAAVGVTAFQRWLLHREKMGELIAKQTAEKAAQYASRTMEMEQRLRVLEQIVTDRGFDTAAQIEALRSAPARKTEEIVR